MRRVGRLFEEIASLDNLLRAYCKARRGKQLASEVQAFGERLHEELATMREGMLCENYPIGLYHCFTVYDPKKRLICAAPFRERVLHHAIMNVCEARFETYQVFDSYACRKGRGVYAALERARRFASQTAWFLKLDVRKYFDSIDHALLRGQVRRLFKDERLLRLLDQIIASYRASPGKGIPIGHLTSQFFANHYLGLLDHFMKETLQARRYVRYMDDFVIWDADKGLLLGMAERIEDFLASGLYLTLKPLCLNRCERGMSFLGYQVFPWGLTLTRRSRDRFVRKIRQIEDHYYEGDWSGREAAEHALPLLAFVRHAQTLNLRRRVLA